MRSMHSAEYRYFRAQLKRARLARGMTQLEVAKALRIPRVTIVKMEAGDRRVDLIEATWFAKLYRKPLSYFVPRKKKPTIAPS